MVSAEEVVRDLAAKGKQRKVLKQLGNFKPSVMANAKATFASAMEPNEIPLVLYDRSFFLTGKAGVLITDQAIYASPQRRVPLDAVTSIQVEKANLTQQMAGGNDIRLVVNGEVLYSQLASLGSNSGFLHFMAEVVNALCARSSNAPAPGRSTATASAAAQQDPVLVAAGAICAGQTREEAIQTLQRTGQPTADASVLIDGLLEQYLKRDKKPLVTNVAAGLGLTALGMAVAIFAGVTGLSSVVAFGGQAIAVAGCVMFFSGGYRLIFGSPPPTALELAAQWRARQSPSATNG